MATTKQSYNVHLVIESTVAEGMDGVLRDIAEALNTSGPAIKKFYFDWAETVPDNK